MKVSLRDLLPPQEQHAISRPLGRACYLRIANWLKLCSDHELFIVEMPRDMWLDYSFSDEVFGQIYAKQAAGGLKGPSIIVAVADDQQLDNLRAAIELRSAAARVLFNGQLSIIAPSGRGMTELLETVRLVDEAGSITAADLAKNNDLGVTGWNNRLVRAYQYRLIDRHTEIAPAGGRAYVYTSPLLQI